MWNWLKYDLNFTGIFRKSTDHNLLHLLYMKIQNPIPATQCRIDSERGHQSFILMSCGFFLIVG